MSRHTLTLEAGSELRVGVPAEPLGQAYELALRELLQGDEALAFVYLPMIGFPGQAPELVLVLFCRRGEDLAAVVERLTVAVRDVLVGVAEELKSAPPDLGLLPVSLGRPLDGLAQAVLQTDTSVHVEDVDAWQQARRPPRPWWLRWLSG